MKAKELAALLLQCPEAEVIISPADKKINPYGMDLEQKVKRVYKPCFWHVPCDTEPIQIVTENF